MKRKKLWIVLVSVIAGLILLFGGVYLLTKLNSVSVEFRTRLSQDETRLETGILDKVKDSAELDYKKSVLFLNTKSAVAKIEKSNPYVKVQQIIRKFPNKVNIYISERIPKYRISDPDSTEKWFILDEDFKVLESLTTTELENKGLNTKTVEIKHISEKVYIGDFLSKPQEMANLNNILSGVYGKTKDYFAVVSIDFLAENSTYFITMKSGIVNYEGGCVMQIVGVNDLKNKAFKATSVYVGSEGALNGVDLSQKVIIISDESGCKVKNQEG